MITVPDQDWMAYGAWLTTPDDTGGPTTGSACSSTAWTPGRPRPLPTTPSSPVHPDGLRGSATYSGGATGVYVDVVGMDEEGDPVHDSGLFTARAMLTADFDKDVHR